MVLELDVGLTLVEVEVEGGAPVAATVHQGAPVFGDPVPRDEIAAVLCIDEDEIDPAFEPMTVGTGLTYTIIPLVSQRALAHVQLDLDFLPAFERDHAEVYPCAFTGRDDPWIEARGLFPFAGIPEDPATGSAAGPLAAFMAHYGRLAPGERRVVLQGKPSPAPAVSWSRWAGRATPSRTCASGARCSRSCGASWTSRTDRIGDLTEGGAGSRRPGRAA